MTRTRVRGPTWWVHCSLWFCPPNKRKVGYWLVFGWFFISSDLEEAWEGQCDCKRLSWCHCQAWKSPSHPTRGDGKWLTLSVSSLNRRVKTVHNSWSCCERALRWSKANPLCNGWYIKNKKNQYRRAVRAQGMLAPRPWKLLLKLAS